MKIKDFIYATIQLFILYIIEKRYYGERMGHRNLYKRKSVQDRSHHSHISPPVPTVWI